MAAEDRKPTQALIDCLKAEPWRFDFYQAMRLLECHYAALPRLGTASRLADEPPVRFGQAVALDFAPSALASYEPGAQEEGQEPAPDWLKVRFFGLFGPNGPLPLHLTSRELRDGDGTFARFADMFHHRLLCLFYRAWAEAQPTVQHDRHGQPPGLGQAREEDRFSRYLASLFGLGMDSLRDRDAMPDRAKLLFAGHFACQNRHAEGLAAIVAAFFGFPARVAEFVGEWMDIAPHEQTRIGHPGQAAQLGVSMVLGSQVFGCQHKFRLVLGPLSLDEYRYLLPGQDGLPELAAIVRNYSGDALAWDVRLVLRREDVPLFCLDGAAQLGWTTWLGGKDADADDLTLYPFAQGAV